MIIFLDVDGVLNPVPFKKHTSPDFTDWQSHEVVIQAAFSPRTKFVIHLSQEMADALSVIESEGNEIKWLTTWGVYANAEIGSRIGWAEKIVVKTGLQSFEEKFDVIENEISNVGPGVVWIDDDIDCGYKGLPMLYSRAAEKPRRMKDPYERLHTYAPNARRGLTKNELINIKQICGNERSVW